MLIGDQATDRAVADWTDGTPAKVFVGYVYQQPQKINFRSIRIFAMRSWWPTRMARSGQARSCPSRQLVADAHQAGVKVLLSLGGWGWDKQFAAIVEQAGSGRSLCRSP